MNTFELPAQVHPSWHEALEPVTAQIVQLWDFLLAEQRSGVRVLPSPEHRWRALEQPLEAVRVLLLGQDPYPTPGHPIGLAFAVDPAVRPLPRSLSNIYRELQDDLGIAPAEHGDLSRWSSQGVLLLNRVLTVRSGQSGSHRGRGWEAVTEAVVSALARRGGPLVAVLWGADAQRAAPLLQGVETVASPHPSPLSASRGFFGSRPFSRVDDSLQAQGAAGVDWSLG